MEQKKSVSGIWGIIILIVIIALIVTSCNNKVDSNDGKCDICGKKKYMVIYGEEFCKEHANFAIDYYLKD